jgi:hypothetical protein
MESGHEKDEKLGAEGGLELIVVEVPTATTDNASDQSLDERADIDPADFFDPQEFGYRGAKGRLRNLWRP